MKKKVAIVTGAAGGIGRAIVAGFLQAGYAIALVDREEDSMKAAIPHGEETATDLLFLAGDLCDDAFLQEIVTRVMDKWGRIDALVNNAMWRKVESIRESSPDDWNKTLAIGITAPAFLSKYVAEAVLEKQQKCCIINLSSVMSSLVSGYASAYSICKGAMESLTYELATTYGPYGCRAIAVRPGSVDTSMSQDYQSTSGDNISQEIQAEIEDRTPLKRSAKPEEIAQAIVWLCAEQAGFITGTCLTIDGGLEHNFNSYSMKHRLKPDTF